MAVKVSGNRGLNFTGTFDISEIEANAKKALDTISGLQKQVSAVNSKTAVDDSYRKEQVAIQKALADSRLALQKLKEEQQAQRVELEKSRAIAAEYRSENERLKLSEQALNLEYKQGKIALQEYTLEQRKIADAQREALRAQREAERTLREQTKLQKEQERQAERNRKALEKESSEYYKLTQALGKVRKEAKDVQAEMFRLEREGLKTSDAYRQLEIRSKALTSQTQILDQGVKRIDASLGLHQRNVGNYGSAWANISPIFANVEQQLGNFGTSLDALATNKDPFKTLGVSLMAFGRATMAFLATPIGAAIAALGALYALISSNKRTVVEFDAGLRGVQKTTNMAEEELYKFGDSVLALSNNLKSVSSKELLEYAQVAGQLGVKGSANILRFSETLARLQTASNISGEQGASEIARLLTLTDGGVENVQAFGDEIVNLGNNFAATEKEILGNAERIAQNTGLYKIGRQEVLAYATATKAVGVEAELVGSTFGRTLGTIEKALRTGSGAQTFATVTGKSVEDLKKAFKEDASGVFNDFIKGLNAVNKAGGSVNAVLEQTGINAIRDQAVLASLATNGYEVLNDAMDKVRDSNGALGTEFETANKKLENVGKRIGVAWDNLVLSIENGQGVFAKVGSYIGNEFADFLVGTKNVIDDVGVAFDVFGQYLDDFKPKAEKASQANMQYANSLGPVADLLNSLTARSFVFTFTVEIPNAFRTAGAYLDIFKTNIEAFGRFLSDASPEIGKYIKDALNPFAEADSTALDAIWDRFKKSAKQTNQFILDDAKRANQQAIDLFRQRYEAATNNNIAGENAARQDQLTPEQLAALEAEQERLKAEVEAAKKAASERIAAQRAMQAKIDEINAAAHRKEMSRDEAEIQAVKDKYRKIRQEIDTFYKNPKNKGLRIDASGLGASEQKELENVRAKQEVEAMKVSIAEQKQLYDQFEQYKAEYGEQKARERFEGDIAGFENYIAYLRSLVPDTSDQSVRAVRMREALEKELQQAEKTARDKAFDENAKRFKQVIDATRSYNSERLSLEQNYQRDLEALRGNLSSPDDAAELAEREKLLTERYNSELEALQYMLFEESALYKEAMRDITFMTKEELKARIRELDRQLKNPDLTPLERSTLQQAKQSAEGYAGVFVDAFGQMVDESDETAVKFREIEAYARETGAVFNQLSSALAGINDDLAATLSTMGQMAEVGANAAGSVASFASGDIVGGITQGISAITGVIKIFSESKQSAKQAAAEMKRLQFDLLQGEMEYNRLMRERERTMENIDRLTTRELQQRRAMLETQEAQAQSDYQRLLQQIQAGGDQITGYKTEKYGGFLGIGKKTRNVAQLDDLYGYGYDQLEALSVQGKLTEETEAMFQELKKAREELEAMGVSAEELQAQFSQVVTGTTAEALADSIINGLRQGKRGFADFAEDFRKTMQEAALSVFQQNFLNAQVGKFYDAFAKASESGLTPEKIESLRQQYATMINDSVGQLEAIEQVVGTIGEGTATSQNTLSGAIRASLTEETGGKLAGILQGQFGLNKQQLAVQEAIKVDMGGLLAIGQEQLTYAMRIEQNTRLNAESSVRIEGKLDTIARNTDPKNSTGTSARDLGYDG